MIGQIQQVLFSFNAYTISLLIIAGLYLFSIFSKNIKKGISTPLFYFAVIWVILFGYRVFTGNNVYDQIMAILYDKEESRYEKVMIDGREVIYDKHTNEIVKPSKE